jgi:5'-AMP-activated protein kinase regulatory beta subunit
VTGVGALAGPPSPQGYQPASLKDEVMQMVAGEFSTTSMQSNSDSKTEETLVPAVFTWTHGGKEVFITGSFNQWLGKIPMHSVSTKEFSLVIDVPPGKHFYKFIVDDEWRFAPDQPTETDNEGRINNVIEVRAYRDDGSFADLGDPDDPTRYEQVIPAQEDYGNEPPSLPPHLAVSLLNGSHATNPATLDPSSLPVPVHVTLHHLYVSNIRSDISLDSPDRFPSPRTPSVFVPSVSGTAVSSGVMVLGVTQRYKTKFVTTVYYKPVPKSSALKFS